MKVCYCIFVKYWKGDFVRRVLIVIGSSEGENSNSYMMARYLKNILKDKVNYDEILLNEIDSNSDKIKNFESYDNLIFISTLRKDDLSDISNKFIENIKKKELNKNIYFSVILDGDKDILEKPEEVEPIIDMCMNICKQKKINWQKGIGVLSDINLWKKGLEVRELEYEHIIMELELLCQDIVNCKTYHHNCFARPLKSKRILGFFNRKIKSF